MKIDAALGNIMTHCNDDMKVFTAMFIFLKNLGAILKMWMSHVLIIGLYSSVASVSGK